MSLFLVDMISPTIIIDTITVIMIKKIVVRVIRTMVKVVMIVMIVIELDWKFYERKKFEIILEKLCPPLISYKIHFDHMGDIGNNNESSETSL